MKKIVALTLVAAALITGALLPTHATTQAIFNDGEPLLVSYK